MNPRRREDPEVSLTPMIDVVFLLLIFFMVSTTFQREAKLQIELPEASNEPVEVEQDQIEITINAEGELFINDQQLVNTDINTLKKGLFQVAGERTDLPVIIRADGKAPHQSVVTVMDAASQLGLTHFSWATVLPEDGGE